MSTIGDRPEKRGRWADFEDSASEEESRPTPLVHTASYDEESAHCNDLRRALSEGMGKLVDKLAGKSASPGGASIDAASMASPTLPNPAASLPSPGPAALQSPLAEDVLAMASPPPPPATPETDSLQRTDSIAAKPGGVMAPSQGAKLGAALLAHIKGQPAQGEKRPRNAAEEEEAEGGRSPARHVARRSPEPPAASTRGLGNDAWTQERRGEKRPVGTRSPPQAAIAPRSPSIDGDGPDGDDAQRRLDKRRAIVAQIKDTPEYKVIQHPSGRGWKSGLRRVRTPDPEDKNISKRSWESLVMHWRKTVQAQGAKFLQGGYHR